MLANFLLTAFSACFGIVLRRLHLPCDGGFWKEKRCAGASTTQQIISVSQFFSACLFSGKRISIVGNIMGRNHLGFSSISVCCQCESSFWGTRIYPSSVERIYLKCVKPTMSHYCARLSIFFRTEKEIKLPVRLIINGRLCCKLYIGKFALFFFSRVVDPSIRRTMFGPNYLLDLNSTTQSAACIYQYAEIHRL